ncbi:MAG: hypothetical protein KGY78_07540 [Anaerolineae bacterium]|nr:hypothetical protein [Anaerolineae bacterium]
MVFVDYDNLARSDRHKGAKYVIDRILQCLGPAWFVDGRAQFRLYGGWYERNSPSRRGQKIAAELQQAFPGLVAATASPNVQPVRVVAELAYSLAAEPLRHLFHTFRKRGIPQGLRCEDPVAMGCSDPACPLTVVYDFVNTGICPSPACQTRAEDLLYRNEQKLVDTMMTVDIVHYAHSGVGQVCVVSSDDDLWPAIRSALLIGTRVIHIHTKPGHATPISYSGGLGPEYVQKRI